MGHIVVHKDIIHKHLKLVSLLVIALSLAIGYGYYTNRQINKLIKLKDSTDTKLLTEQLANALLAGKIVDYYHDQRRIVSYRDVLETTTAIKRFLPKIFNKVDTFDYIDILTVAMIESDFNPRAVSSVRALGVMQVLHYKNYVVEIDGVKDPYNIPCNVYMGLTVLKIKHNLHKDKKKTLIAYNSLIYDKEGNLIEKYWYKFKKHNDILRGML